MQGNGNGPALVTARFDLSTKLAILTALIIEGFCSADIERAVDVAEKINALCDTRAEQLKAARK